ncbi:hypothetical protein DFH09DRAFT_1318725 [Mycena vulgaris]|nr:hypothetical protein DFH09DRAFT_1318725 [Mycena vulgaris]
MPNYWPAREHFHSQDAHSAAVDCFFFAVLWGRVPAIYTTMKQVNDCLIEFDGARWAQAATWEGIIAIWNEYCLQNHDHVIDISPVSTPPSSSTSALPKDDGSAPASPTKPSVRKRAVSFQLPRAPPPPIPTSPGRLPPLPPRLRAERAAERLEAAAEQAEAAARQICENADRTYAMAREAEVCARRISEHAERAFTLLRNASKAACNIGEEADRVVEIIRATGIATEGLFPLRHAAGMPSAVEGLELDPIARANAAVGQMDGLLSGNLAVDWVRQQRERLS